MDSNEPTNPDAELAEDRADVKAANAEDGADGDLTFIDDFLADLSPEELQAVCDKAQALMPDQGPMSDADAEDNAYDTAVGLKPAPKGKSPNPFAK